MAMCVVTNIGIVGAGWDFGDLGDFFWQEFFGQKKRVREGAVIS